MSRIADAAVGLALATALLLAPAGWAEQTEDSEVTFLSLRELRVDREYDLTGYEKDLLQEEIDQAGDDDGTVESFDIREWRELRGREATGRTSPDHVLDGQTGTIVSWDASVSDALGDYDDPDNDPDDESDDRVRLRILETIAFDVGDDGTHTYHLPSPSRDSKFEFEVPPGHAIVSTSGLSNAVMGQDGRSVRGDASLNRAIHIDFQRAGEVIGLPTLGDLIGPDAKLAGTLTELEWTSDVRVAHYTLSGQVSGLDAVALRGLIDEAGNADGTVTESEAEDVLDRFIRSRLGTPSAMFVMGGAPGTIGAVDISVEGIEGPVGTQNAISIETTGIVAFDVPQRATELSLVITKTARNARISVELPEGYSVQDDEGYDGLRGASFEDSRRTITADEEDEGSIRISFVEAYSFGGFHWGQWVSVILGLVALIGVIVFLAITDRRLSRVVRAVHELEDIQRHAVHGPRHAGEPHPGEHGHEDHGPHREHR